MLIALLLALSVVLQNAAAAQKPNIVAIMLDDWGYNNWGVHAKNKANSREVRTPVLDGLASVGIALDRHYTASVCSPSRAAFQTGRNPLHVTAVNGDAGRYNPDDTISGFDGIPTAMTGIASLGYKKSLAFLCSGNRYWTYDAQFGICGDGGGVKLTDLWEDDGPAINLKPAADCSNALPNCFYEDELFEKRAVQWIKAHDARKPLFMVYAPHAVHSPLAPTAAQLQAFDFVQGSWSRKVYAATLADIDTRIGTIIQTLKNKNLWQNTLVVVMSDNGGPIALTGGASNFPLRGGKYSNFEGGVRTNALVSGGFVPAARQNTTLTGFIGVEDWYSTFSALAGVNPTDTKAQKAGLPPIDSINMWPYLSGLKNVSPRKEVVLASTSGGGGTKTQSLIDAKGYKLLAGTLKYAASSPAINPTAATPDDAHMPKLACGRRDPVYPYTGACLFNILKDPAETTNIAAQHPDIVVRLAERMKEIQATAFSPQRGAVPKDKVNTLPCQSALANLSGFEGPWLDMPFSNSTAAR